VSNNTFPQPPFQASTFDPKSGKMSMVWQNWISLVQLALTGLVIYGPTANRPTQNLYPGYLYFNTDIGKPEWWNAETNTWVTWP
jgi:hypothetical protein